MLGRHVFTADERFQILKPVEDHEQSLRPIPHQPNLTEWILQIQFVQQRDGGYYLCQVCYLTCMYRLSFLFYRKGHCNVQLNEHSLHCSLPPFFFSVAFVQETGLVFLAAPLFFLERIVRASISSWIYQSYWFLFCLFSPLSDG